MVHRQAGAKHVADLPPVDLLVSPFHQKFSPESSFLGGGRWIENSASYRSGSPDALTSLVLRHNFNARFEKCIVKSNCRPQRVLPNESYEPLR